MWSFATIANRQSLTHILKRGAPELNWADFASEIECKMFSRLENVATKRQESFRETREQVLKNELPLHAKD